MSDTMPPLQGGTTTTTAPETRTSHGDHGDELFHYVRKDHIVESAVTGAIVTALCGATFPVTRAAKPGSPVCPACKEMRDLLRDMGGSGEAPG